MMGKVIDFLKTTKDEDEVRPLEKDQILANLENINGEIIIEYMMAIDNGVERMLLFKNFIGSKFRPKLSKLLLEQIKPKWLNGLRDVVFHLSFLDIDKKVEKIVNATIGEILEPSKESCDKAEFLVEKIMSQKCDLKEIGKEFYRRADLLRWLGAAFSVLGEGDEFEKTAKERLSRFSSEDLDVMIDTIKNEKSLH